VVSAVVIGQWWNYEWGVVQLQCEEWCWWCDMVMLVSGVVVGVVSGVQVQCSVVVAVAVKVLRKCSECSTNI
jgi:hypothetical protein